MIRLAVAPVFLLTAIATMINSMNTRLGRIIDRRRVMQERIKNSSAPQMDELKDEMKTLIHRSRLIYMAILFAVLAALLVCVVVAGAFVGALISVDLAKYVAVSFVLAMSSMIVSLSMFLREVYLGVSSGVNLKR
ncbi:DUF2721 domain-containing protein [Propionivibrio limicola]|uniref:DUF2721 domain-containing protein n=1 Tax=Propionivibrio limicola TaxID=167645 RepID=UPI001FEB9EE3|nr:DUF2721 domain-containing protein [Propionivibrio limicola]